MENHQIHHSCMKFHSDFVFFIKIWYIFSFLIDIWVLINDKFTIFWYQIFSSYSDSINNQLDWNFWNKKRKIKTFKKGLLNFHKLKQLLGCNKKFFKMLQPNNIFSYLEIKVKSFFDIWYSFLIRKFNLPKKK